MAFEIRELTGIGAAIPACEAIGREHYEEIARNKDLMVYAPDVARYEKLEALGVLLTLAVYDGEQIVGYSVNILSTHLHYSGLQCASNDMLFIAKAYRQGSLGVKLIKATKAACAARGAKLMLWHAKEDTPLAVLLPRMGCAVQDIVFSEAL